MREVPRTFGDRDDARSAVSGEWRVPYDHDSPLTILHSQFSILNSQLALRHPEERSDEGPRAFPDTFVERLDMSH